MTHHTHDLAELCEAGDSAYGEALRRGRVRRGEVADAPCLIDLGLLHPDPDDMESLVPTSPSVALHTALRDIEAEIHESRAREARIARVLEGFSSPERGDRISSIGGVVVLEGLPRINAAIDRALHACRTELLCVQPGARSEAILREALPKHLRLRDRGVRMRSLYGRASLHSPALKGFLHQVGDALEVRSLSDLPQRMFIMDHDVAFIPADRDGFSAALELRQPALVEYLVSVFERLWHQALQTSGATPSSATAEGVTERQTAIARLLAEGHADEVVARRLGISVRTCRKHVAQLSAVFGSTNRVQLGVRIARSGLLDAPGPGGRLR
ncbi:helix-turn-helix transcriptional regulator [Streptomyces sp. ISL-10]|uniref:helix-turn-helix transcriptional regulator n=1 Tax=Streptomyces sp. ISL-10 TaxID=2819172 RepID=UPI001BE7D92F|nr:helix-turn-helix transcriptional regulator [Streptomyces sp. ISL-10]MBT2368103.1 helix-turn-helix transcriptional regulator [Streptomyces sp. ISL-10]